MKCMVEIYYSEKNYPDENMMAECTVYDVSSEEEAMAAAISELKEQEAIDTIFEVRVEPVVSTITFSKEDVNFSNINKFTRPNSASIDNFNISPIW